jgi:enoyl-CoA hydratase
MTQVETIRRHDCATIQFSSENGINVFDTHVLGELANHVEQLLTDEDVRFVAFRGVGRTFVAGADIREMNGLDEAGARAFSEKGHGVFDMIEGLHQVTVAAINGPALGGGSELALACDFRVMAARATIGQPETRLGLIPGWGGTHRLARIVGLSRAKRLIFGGEAIGADEAFRIGLVDEIVNGDEELDKALSCLCALFRHGAPSAIARAKQAIREGSEPVVFATCFADAEGKEGMGAFLEKRPAAWMD